MSSSPTGCCAVQWTLDSTASSGRRRHIEIHCIQYTLNTTHYTQFTPYTVHCKESYHRRPHIDTNWLTSPRIQKCTAILCTVYCIFVHSKLFNCTIYSLPCCHLNMRSQWHGRMWVQIYRILHPGLLRLQTTEYILQRTKHDK